MKFLVRDYTKRAANDRVQHFCTEKGGQTLNCALHIIDEFSESQEGEMRPRVLKRCFELEIVGRRLAEGLLHVRVVAFPKPALMVGQPRIQDKCAKVFCLQ